MTASSSIASVTGSTPVYSMTGFATLRVDTTETPGFTLTLKSVNHRHLDLQLRLPHSFDALEARLRKELKELIHRGHVEFTLELDRQSRSSIALNDEQIATYIAAFRAAARAHGLAADPNLNDILRLPGMMSSQPGAMPDTGALETSILAELPNLLVRFNAVRVEEGSALAAELRAAMSRIDTLAGEVSSFREGVRLANFDRLRARIAELTGGLSVSEDRILAEAALLADRSDIEEELVRLRTHAATFINLLNQGGPVGKQLDFLLQELNREANTLLSKTGGASSRNGLRITDLGLSIKLEIERAREQVQNLE